jgi:Rogdi leucine zipper containing protein
VLPQLLSVRALINDSLDIIDVSRWTGQSTDASFISGQLKLLHDNLNEAKASLKGPIPGEMHERMPGGQWWTSSPEDVVFDPPLSGSVSLHFIIQDANLILTVRTLAPATPLRTPTTPTGDLSFSLSGFNLRSRLLGLGSRLPTHDEMGETFNWRGMYDVSVREKVRVESGDPSLMSVAAKLSALEHEVARWRENLRIVMDESEEED